MTENPLLRSIPKEHGFRFVPFEFENMPLIMDHNLDHDIYRLRQFTFLWLDGLEAEQTAFLHMGENAERLFLRRGGSDPWRWQDFLRAAGGWITNSWRFSKKPWRRAMPSRHLP